MKYKGVPISTISIINTPSIYFELLVFTIRDHLFTLARFAKKRALVLLSVVVAWGLITYLPFLQVFHFLYRG